jgi:plasmid stability protein
MLVDLSIKNVPDAVAHRLRQRAARHHRSLQGELMAIIEAAARQDIEAAARQDIEAAARQDIEAAARQDIEAAVLEDRPAAPVDILAKIRGLGLQSPAEAVEIVRADRDAR